MKTVETLYQQYGRKYVFLNDIARDYLGINDSTAVGRRALQNDLYGIKPFRLGNRKSPWLCDIEQVAKVLDRIANS